ncbi:MAG: hypothetical protein K9H11_17215, partial [Rhodospirillum sp.]|nr:hypothetical protein [Rhodospirillum sp.]
MGPPHPRIRTLKPWPHLLVNRPRLYTSGDPPLNSEKHATCKTINAVRYRGGGVTFVVGSVHFFPAWPPYQDLGGKLFVQERRLYLMVSVHDMIEVLRDNQVLTDRMEAFALEFLAAPLKG